MKSQEILRDVAQTIENIEKKINSLTKLSDKNKQKALKLLEEARRNFMELSENVAVDNQELANFFLKRAVKIKNNTNDRYLEKMGEKEYMKDIAALNKYSKAAPYDFAGEVKVLHRAYRAFLFGMIPFYIVSGIFGPVYAVTALILIIPTLLAMLSMRKRGSLGLMLAFAVMPIPMVMGAFSIRYGIYALTNQEELMRIAQELGKSLAFAQAIAAIILLSGAASLILLGYASYALYKHRHAFL
ncbi:alpha-glucosidase [Thermococcus sp. LS1]|uniref:alpha-glucosidase n=1 Tax=Thermococcus sp. LS1 TaxID=1638259 RepID=UPI001439D366|nr:alpha-glucosidase [Thermococcus sp. LS1]NJE00080.1 alpha-glucosidase [Thermococcus sp. LS1]